MGIVSEIDSSTLMEVSSAAALQYTSRTSRAEVTWAVAVLSQYHLTSLVRVLETLLRTPDLRQAHEARAWGPEPQSQLVCWYLSEGA
jgi:hypothetical protein